MNDPVFKFADFELDVAEAELRNGETGIRLQEKPLLLLRTLLEHPQSLVTRQQLRDRMWASDTFVDYEQGINVAIKKVRDALGDSAENPKFIQTIAKRGYRFLIPVHVIEPPATQAPGINRPATPQPQRITEPVAIPHPVRRWLPAALGVLVLLLAAVWLYRVETIRARHRTQIQSIAVLPLRDLSPQPGQEYFADGVTEDVITNLAQSLPLRVISRTSVMRYKQTTEPITQIAQELGVEAIVEGAVARSGKRVIVTVQLIDATQDRHLWAQKYDRDIKDVLNIESEISREIATQVGGTLVAQHVINSSRTVDPEVYELCLLGRYYWNKRTAAGLTKSAAYYQQAIDRDPNYAPAYAGLANAYALKVVYDNVPVQETFANARAAAQHALELDNTLAEPHAALGLIALNARDWKPAGPELRRALDLNPNDATAHHWFSFYLLFSGKTDEAIAEIETARQLDPLSPVINADEGVFLYTSRRYDEARVRLRQAIDLEPDFDQPHETLALINLETGDPSNALKEARAGLALSSTNARTLAEAGYVLAMTGHPDEATKLLAAVKAMSGNGAPEPLFEALIEVGLKDHDAALRALEEDGRIFGLIGLIQWHAFDQISAEPRIHQLIAETQ